MALPKVVRRGEPTNKQHVQSRIWEQIDTYVRLLRDELRDRYGTASARALGRLRRLWEEDLTPTSAAFPADQNDNTTWMQVEQHLRPALDKIQVRTINGSSQDALEYYEHRRAGLSVIAIGGDKLSRGLTLEGLSVSYYLRASKTYDTLLQMGRWFGYRPRYEDLCRLYTTSALRDAYCEITLADDELRRDFDEMSALDAKPMDFGLRMRTSPIGLGITAANKIRRGLKVKLSYTGDMPETIMFDLRSVEHNFEVLTDFVGRLNQVAKAERDPSASTRPSIVWEGVGPDDIVDAFLDRYVGDAKARSARPAFIAEYIRRCRKVGELSNWTVRLVSSNSGSPQKIGAHTVGLVKRAELRKDAIDDDRYVIRRVVSPSDEATDLDPIQRKRALEETERKATADAERGGKARDPKIPSGQAVRRQRRPDQPLLLLYPLEHPRVMPPSDDGVRPDAPLPVVGFAISFPYSRHDNEVEYVVNDIWIQQELDDFNEDAE